MTGGGARAWVATVARGFFVGAADLVPGVSGATVAIVLGIYERLVAAIRGFDLAFAGRALRLDLPGAARHVDAQGSCSLSSSGLRSRRCSSPAWCRSRS